MSRRYGFCVVALGGLAVAATQGAFAATEQMPPIPRKLNSASEDKKATANLAVTTNGPSKPAPVRFVPPAEPKARDNPVSAGQADQIELGSWPDWAVVAFTALLAWLSWRQHKLETSLAEKTGDALELARISASAAEKSAQISERILSGLERPHLSIEISQETYLAELERKRAGQIGYKYDGFHTDFTVTNFGRSPALFVRVQSLGDGWSDDIPKLEVEPPPHLHVGQYGPATELGEIAPGASARGRERSMMGFADHVGERFYFRGAVIYEDVFGQEYRTYFLWSGHQGGMGFGPAIQRLPGHEWNKRT